MYLPYLGAYTSAHFPNNRARWYGGDSADTYQQFLMSRTQSHPREAQSDKAVGEEAYIDSFSDKWEYQFNELGYRGESYDPSAEFTLAVIGCSVSVGVGVPIECTWGTRLAGKIKQYLRLKRVSCLNFSQSGCSNDYIARTALRQFSAKKPTMAVILFTRMMRRELLKGDSILTFGTWTVNEDPMLQSLLDCYTNEEAAANLVKNVLLVSNYCALNKIPLVYSVMELSLLEEKIFPRHPVLSELWSTSAHDNLLRYGMRWGDCGRDNAHPGPRSHENFAQQIFESITMMEVNNPLVRP
jgi:hypothetical protein